MFLRIGLGRVGGTALWLVALCSVVGCSGGRQEALLPPQSLAVERPAAPPAAEAAIAPLEPAPASAGLGGATATDASAEPAPPPARPKPNGAAARARDSADESLLRIDESDGASGLADNVELLRELSQSERERRRNAPPARLVLTDDNLAAHAEGAGLTFSSNGGTPAVEEGSIPEGEAAGAPAAATTPTTATTEQAEQERYWRSRVLEVRQRWRHAYDDVPRLEEDVERLRTAFYAEDDPARRDRQIKPLWDRALDRLRETREEIEQAREELELLLVEGDRAGALPGWLREGIELQPPIEPLEAEGETLEEADPEEPVAVEPLGREPPGR